MFIKNTANKGDFSLASIGIRRFLFIFYCGRSKAITIILSISILQYVWIIINVHIDFKYATQAVLTKKKSGEALIVITTSSSVQVVFVLSCTYNHIMLKLVILLRRNKSGDW